jgi:cytochrome c oxidase cbb3-type subunit III
VIRHPAIARSILFSAVATTVGCSPSGGPRAESRPIRSDKVTDFATLYGRHCAGCHGADGQYGPAPPLNDPLFLAIVPDEVLLRLVAEGRPGTPMPAFSRKKGGTLTDEQVRAVASGIKSRWDAGRPKATPPDYLVAADRSDGDAGRGRAVFERACASCHGPDGSGGEDMVGPIHDPAFLALISDQAVRRFILTGRRDLGMPDFAGKAGRPPDFRPLSPTDVADLVEFVSGWRRASR